jgi:hypothetical protein
VIVLAASLALAWLAPSETTRRARRMS